MAAPRRSRPSACWIARLAALVEERAIAGGADPASVHVYTESVPEKGGIRAVAIGNVGLEAGAEREIDAAEALQIAARRVRAPAAKLGALGATAHYYVFGPAAGRAWPWAKRPPVVVVDHHGSVRLETDDAEALAGPPAQVLARLRATLAAPQGGAFGLGPRLYLLIGRRLLDLSALNKVEDALAAAEKALAGPGAGDVVALVQRARLL